MYVREYPWLYFNPAEKGWECKKCELFPATGSGNTNLQFAKEAVTSLTNYPRCFLQNNNNSTKHQCAVNEHEGM